MSQHKITILTENSGGTEALLHITPSIEIGPLFATYLLPSSVTAELVLAKTGSGGTLLHIQTPGNVQPADVVRELRKRLNDFNRIEL